LAWYGKTKPNTTKARIHQSQETLLQHKINTKKPGLIAFYDNRLGNEVGLFSKKKISKGEEISKEKVKKKGTSGEAFDM